MLSRTPVTECGGCDSVRRGYRGVHAYDEGMLVGLALWSFQTAGLGGVVHAALFGFEQEEQVH